MATSVNVGTIYIESIVDTKGLQKGLSNAEKMVKDSNIKIAKSYDQLAKDIAASGDNIEKALTKISNASKNMANSIEISNKNLVDGTAAKAFNTYANSVINKEKQIEQQVKTSNQKMETNTITTTSDINQAWSNMYQSMAGMTQSFSAITGNQFQGVFNPDYSGAMGVYSSLNQLSAFFGETTESMIADMKALQEATGYAALGMVDFAVKNAQALGTAKLDAEMYTDVIMDMINAQIAFIALGYDMQQVSMAFLQAAQGDYLALRELGIAMDEAGVEQFYNDVMTGTIALEQFGIETEKVANVVSTFSGKAYDDLTQQEKAIFRVTDAYIMMFDQVQKGSEIMQSEGMQALFDYRTALTEVRLEMSKTALAIMDTLLPALTALMNGYLELSDGVQGLVNSILLIAPAALSGVAALGELAVSVASIFGISNIFRGRSFFGNRVIMTSDSAGNTWPWRPARGLIGAWDRFSNKTPILSSLWAGGIFSSIASSIAKAFTEINYNILKPLGGDLSNITPSLKSLGKRLAVGAAVSPIPFDLAVTAGIAAIIRNWDEMATYWEGIMGDMNAAWNFLFSEGGSLSGAWSYFWGLRVADETTIVHWWDGLMKDIASVWDLAFNGIMGDAWATFWAMRLEDAGPIYAWWDGLMKDIASAWDLAFNGVMGDAWNTFWAARFEDAGPIWIWWDGLMKSLTEAWRYFTEVGIVGLWNAAFANLKENSGPIYAWWDEFCFNLENRWSQAMSSLEAMFENALQAMKNAAAVLFPGITALIADDADPDTPGLQSSALGLNSYSNQPVPMSALSQMGLNRRNLSISLTSPNTYLDSELIAQGVTRRVQTELRI